MIEHPGNHINLFLENLRKGDTVYIHPEAEYHPSTTLQRVIDAGMIPGIAINPGTSVETVMEMPAAFEEYRFLPIESRLELQGIDADINDDDVFKIVKENFDKSGYVADFDKLFGEFEKSKKILKKII